MSNEEANVDNLFNPDQVPLDDKETNGHAPIKLFNNHLASERSNYKANLFSMKIHLSICHQLMV